MSFAGLIDAVIATVNQEPILLSELETSKETYKINSEDALELLIRKKLKEQKIKALNISLSDYDVEQRMELIAAQNHISLAMLKEGLKLQNIDEDLYKNKLKEQMLDEELGKNILSLEPLSVDDDEIKTYYQNHIEEYKIPKSVKVVQYASTNSQELAFLIQSPLYNSPNISKKTQIIDTSKVQTQLSKILAKTPINSFTPITQHNNAFFTLLVQEKIGQIQNPLDLVKDDISLQLLNEKRKRTLADFFAKERSKASVKILRQ